MVRDTDDRYELMSWKVFEDHVVGLLGRIYSTYGFRVVKTPYQNDGGKDGYGSLQIGPVQSIAGQDLSIITCLWAEVKKRSSSKVDLDDLGGHLILALDQKVNKIIFVTNSRFSARARRLCALTGDRLNLGVTFIDGHSLRELEILYADTAVATPPVDVNDLVEPQALSTKIETSSENLTIRCGFVSSRDGDLDRLHAEMYVDVGEISYWVCEIDGSANETFIEVDTIPSNDKLRCVFLTARQLKIEGVETHQRITVAIWSDHPAQLPPSVLRVHVNAPEGRNPTKIVYGPGALHIRATVLSSMIPASRQEIISSAGREYRRIAGEGGISWFLLEAVAGAGKSFLLQRLRQEFLRQGVREIRLDGADDVGIDRVVQSILLQTFPLPSELVPSIPPDVLSVWLDQASHADDRQAAITTLPPLLAGIGKPGKDQAVVELVASTLINASVTNPVVVTFEDLHKANAAVFDFLQRLSGVLASRRKGKIFVILTTRPAAIDQGGNDFAGTLQDLGSSQARVEFHRLVSLSWSETLSLLEDSMRGITKTEAELIVEQVGSNPFALREALQYLRTDGTIDLSPDGLFYVAAPEGIRKAARMGVLLTATSNRLRWLAEQIGEWFDKFILVGACLGKSFSIADALTGIGRAADENIERVVDLCFDYDVLTPHRENAGQERVDIAFDHDLVRNAVLLQAGEKKIRFSAQRLLITLMPSLRDQQRMLLYYLAGAAESCMLIADKLLLDARIRMNRVEAVQFAFLRVALLIAADSTTGKSNFLLPQLDRIDEALALVPVPELPSRPFPVVVANGLEDLLAEMEHVGMLENEISARLLTLAQMYAGYARDNVASSKFRYYEGRRLFGMNLYAEAYEAFLDAERIWPKGIESRAPELSRVRLRQAICERHLGNLEGARRTMKRALRLRPGPDWKLFESVVANLGAFYMYEDQKQAATYWSKGLRVARLAGHVDEVAHFLNDLAHIALMECRYGAALDTLNQAGAVIEKHGLRKEQLRSNILTACIFLCLDRLAPARHALSQAEDLALSHGDLRRLWRVRANMATWAEISSRPEEAVIYDLQALVHMPILTEFDGTGTIGGRGNRVTGALMNLVHRHNAMPERYAGVKDRIGEQTWSTMMVLAAELAVAQQIPKTFAGGIGCLCQPVGNGAVTRFLITE